MAHKRMFSKDITENDTFLDMPLSAQALYFHLGMQADDDGFVSPNRVVRMIGCQADDLKILIGKRFVMPFEDGVVVIKHWKLNNYIPKDRYKKTTHQDKMAQLSLKSNGVYTLYTECIQNGYAEENRIEENRIEKNRKVKTGKQSSPKKTTTHNPLGAEVIKEFEAIDGKNKTYYGNKTQRSACDFLIGEYGLEEVKNRIKWLAKTNTMPYFPVITTPCQLRDKWKQLEGAMVRHQDNQTVLL